MSELRREIKWEPGFDHRNDPDPTKRQYGCRGMTIRFLLHGERGTMQFVISTGWLPGQQWKAEKVLGPMATDVGYHWDSPRYEGQGWLECSVRPNGRCYYDGSSLMADELFAKFTTVGEAAVWELLEQRYEHYASFDLPDGPEGGLA